VTGQICFRTRQGYEAAESSATAWGSPEQLVRVVQTLSAIRTAEVAASSYPLDPGISIPYTERFHMPTLQPDRLSR